MLRKLGARVAVDYRGPNVVNEVLRLAGRNVAFVLDCIGSLKGSVEPIRHIADFGSTVAIALPVIVRDAGVDVVPVYSMDVGDVVEWKKGVEVVGIRTHFYLEVRKEFRSWDHCD